MITLNPILRALDEQRRALLLQLDAVERAIAALNSVAMPPALAPPDEPPAAEYSASVVLPRCVPSRRVLKEAHMEALVAGKRKALHAREAAKGLARDVPDDSFVPAIGRRGHQQPPRLVKRPAGK